MAKVPFILTLLLVLSCSPNEDKTISIAGAWINDGGGAYDSTGQYYRNEWIFDSNHSYEKTLKIMGSDEEIVGYLSLSTGEYQLVGNILRLSNTDEYGLDNMNDYLPKKELILVATEIQYREVQISMDNSLDTLTIGYSGAECFETGICIDEERFYRK